MKQFLIALFLCLVGVGACSRQPEYETILLPIEANGLWGFVDCNGDWIVKPKYESEEILVDHMARVNYGGLWGFVNEAGEEVIEPTFDMARRFTEGKGAVQIQGSWGFVDRKGDVVIPIKYTFVRSFSDSLAVVQVDSLLGFINHNNEMVIPPIYVGAKDFHEGAARVTEDGKLFGLITKNRTLLGGRWFEDVHAPSEGRFAFMSGGRWGYRDMQGKVVVPPKYAYAKDYSDGRVVVGNAYKQEFGVLDLDGNVVIESGIYSFMRPYKDGYAQARRGSAWGFVDTDGNEVVSPRENVAYQDFSEGLAAYRDSTAHWGFVDAENHIVIEPKFDDVYGFQEGVCFVRLDDKRGYINKKGEYIVEPSF